MATLAPALAQLRAEVNATWPDRSKASDGTLGDPAHAARTSDHNPNAFGVVRALDITAWGIDSTAYADHIRQLGLAGFPALQNHGYVIYARWAAYQTNGWRWVAYGGTNPHTTHIHVSVGRDPAQYDHTGSWRIADIEGDDMSQQDITDIKATLADLQRTLKGNGDASVYWNGHWTRKMAKDIQDRVTALEDLLAEIHDAMPAP